MPTIHYPPPIRLPNGEAVTCATYLCSILDAYPEMGRGATNRRAHAFLHATLTQHDDHADLPAEALAVLRAALDAVAVKPEVGRLVIGFDAAVMHAAAQPSEPPHADE